jgi:hypothetical protein
MDDLDIGRNVSKVFRAAVNDMLQNGHDEILCPCSKCKNRVWLDPFTSTVKSHLLRNRFMNSYTWWISEEDDDVADVEVVADEEGGNNNDEEPEEGRNKLAPGWDQDDGYEEEGYE